MTSSVPVLGNSASSKTVTDPNNRPAKKSRFQELLDCALALPEKKVPEKGFQKDLKAEVLTENSTNPSSAAATEKTLFSSTTTARKTESKVRQQLQRQRQTRDLKGVEIIDLTSANKEPKTLETAASSTSSKSDKVSKPLPLDRPPLPAFKEMEFQLHPLDVWGKSSQYEDLRGKLICTPAAGHCLTLLAKGEKITPASIDSFIEEGLQSYKKSLKITEEEWDKAAKDSTFLKSRFHPLEVTECINPELEIREEYHVLSPEPSFNMESLQDPSYLPLPEKEFSQVFGSIIGVAKSSKGEPVAAFLVFGCPGRTVAETFALCVQELKDQTLSFKLFNPHGTDASRNMESGLLSDRNQTKGPARLNCFEGKSFGESAEKRFNRYFSNLLGNIGVFPGSQISISMLKRKE